MKRKKRKFRNSITKKIVVLIMTAMIAMMVVSVVMIKLIEYSYRGYVYESKSDSLRASVQGVQQELTEVENVTYQFLTDTDVQSSITKWLAANNVQNSLNVDNLVIQESRKKKTESVQELLERLDPYITTSNIISTGFFITPDDQRHNGYGGNTLDLSDEQLRKIVSLAKKAGGSCVYFPYPDSRLIVARVIREKSGLSLAYGGTLIFEIALENLSLAATASENSHLLIVGKDQTVIFSDLQDEEMEFLQNLNTMSEDSWQLVQTSRGTCFVTGTVYEKLAWNFYSISSYQELFGLMERADMVYMMIFLLLAVMIVVFAVQLSLHMVRPITNLSGRIQEIRDNRDNHDIARNLQSAISQQSSPEVREDEIGELQEEFFGMIGELDVLIRENYEQKIDLQQAQLSALRAQLNPHFLYNTLEEIRWMATPQYYQQIPTVVLALGNILRRAMNIRESKISIGEEIDYLRSYIQIQKIRFGDRLSVELRIPEELMDYLIPVFGLQILVENSVNYAAEQTSDVCCICVSVTRMGEVLTCTVEDNGPGIEENVIEKIKNGVANAHGNGIGLMNLDHRLRNLYGPQYGVHVESCTQGGARVSFEVKKERKKGNEKADCRGSG